MIPPKAMTSTNLAQERRISKWGVLYFWQPIINKELMPYDLFFDELICVKKSGPFIYSGYFTVGYSSAKSHDVEFCQLIVQFDEKGRICKRRLLTWKEEGRCLISQIPKNMLILDNRANFFLEKPAKPCQVS
jgi:hypothetical protein